MKLKILIYGLFFMIFAISCSESIIEPDALTYKTSELKAGILNAKYYVSKSGSNSNVGSLIAPFLSIQKAASIAVAGDTVFIRTGVYQERVSFENNGTSASRIVIQSYPSETAVIDGNNYTIPTDTYSYLVRLYGNYITIKNIEIRNSFGMALLLQGTNCLADNINAHHNWQSGILIMGNYGIAQNCIAAYNCQNNIANPGAQLNGSGISAARAPDYPIIKNNLIHDNWGEGISMFECTHGTMQDNTVYDNWSANMYISDVTDLLAQRNLIYQTKNMTSGSQVGILLGDEKNNPQSANVTVVNNVVNGCRRNLYWWGSNAGTGMTNFNFYNNTLVNSTYSNCVQFNQVGTDNGVQFKNNIISQNAGLLPILMTSNTGKTFSNNLWSNTPCAVATGTCTVIGDPKFTDVNHPYLAESYKLTSTSPAINAGIIAGITTDFLKNSIVGLPDIGAFEYSSSNTPSITYYNIQSSATSAKNDCGTGYTGSIVTYTISANKYSSNISQTDADSKALADLNTPKQAYANTNGTCTLIPVYYSTSASTVATKNDCGTGYVGSTVTYTVSANKYSSTISQTDADGKAMADLNNNKQAYANTNGTCTIIPVYYNTSISTIATKNDCGTGYTGSSVTYTVSANKYSSIISQTDADSKAMADVNTNKQAYANTNGICTIIPVKVYNNIQMSSTVTKNSCGIGYIGSKVTYTISAGKYRSTVSQADADAKAITDLSTNGQSYANMNGTCTLIKKWKR